MAKRRKSRKKSIEQERTLARHLIRWKFFDPGETWDDWIKSLQKEVEWVKDMKAKGAELDTSSAGDDYWWYTIPGHFAAPDENGTVWEDEDGPCETCDPPEDRAADALEQAKS